MATEPFISQPLPLPVSIAGLVNVNTNAAQACMAAINYEVMVAWHTLASPAAKQRFFNEAYPALKVGLGEYIDAMSVAKPKMLHHVYEWKMEGDPAGRLWRTKKVITGESSFKINYYFTMSKKVVPIDPVLKIPGPTGRSVTKSVIFRNKAIIMEDGQPVVVKIYPPKMLTIPEPSNPRGFIFYPYSAVVKNPGGVGVKLGFSRAFSSWFVTGLATKYLKASGVYDRVAARTTIAGNKIPAKIKKLTIGGSISKQEIKALALAASEAVNI